MSDKKRSQLRGLIIAFIIILTLTSGFAAKIRSTIFTHVTWEQIVLGVISLRIAYILLTEVFISKKR